MSKNNDEKSEGDDLQRQTTQHSLLAQICHIPSARLHAPCSSLDEEGENIGNEEDFDEPSTTDEEAAVGDVLAEGEGESGEEDVVGGEEEAGLQRWEAVSWGVIEVLRCAGERQTERRVTWRDASEN